MKGKRYTTEEKMRILREAIGGRPSAIERGLIRIGLRLRSRIAERALRPCLATSALHHRPSK